MAGAKVNIKKHERKDRLRRRKTAKSLISTAKQALSAGREEGVKLILSEK